MGGGRLRRGKGVEAASPRLASPRLAMQVVQRGKAPLSSMQDAITCVRITEAAERSIAEGVHVPL